MEKLKIEELEERIAKLEAKVFPAGAETEAAVAEKPAEDPQTKPWLSDEEHRDG